MIHDERTSELPKDEEQEPLGGEAEILLATIDQTSDDKLTRFAIRLALSGHVGIPRENEFDFLAEAETVFASPQKEDTTRNTRNVPATAKSKTEPKKKTAKQQVAAYPKREPPIGSRNLAAQTLAAR